jgi:drebrin-like protein
MVEDDEPGASAPAPVPAAAEPTPAAAPAPAATQGATATALYDYEAGEDNELSFPENAIIANVVSWSLDPGPINPHLHGSTQSFPDEDWWHGEYNGHAGLFPANYTKLND